MFIDSSEAELKKAGKFKRHARYSEGHFHKKAYPHCSYAIWNSHTAPYLFPIASIFSHPTLASFFYAILTNYTLRFHEDFELFTINNSEKGVYNGRTSKKEFQYQGRS